MIINIKAKNFELTPAIRIYIETKINHLEKFLSEELKRDSVRVDFEAAKTTRRQHKGNIFYAEANLKINGAILRANKTAENLRTAIDRVKDALAEEIKRFKSTR